MNGLESCSIQYKDLMTCSMAPKPIERKKWFNCLIFQGFKSDTMSVEKIRSRKKPSTAFIIIMSHLLKIHILEARVKRSSSTRCSSASGCCKFCTIFYYLRPDSVGNSSSNSNCRPIIVTQPHLFWRKDVRITATAIANSHA